MAAPSGLLCPCHAGRGTYGDVRVLVVEDQKVLADRIAEGLRDQGMAVDIAYDGAAAMEIAAFTATTSSCSTATCPGCTATRCALTWWRARPRPGS